MSYNTWQEALAALVKEHGIEDSELGDISARIARSRVLGRDTAQLDMLDRFPTARKRPAAEGKRRLPSWWRKPTSPDAA